MTLYDVIVVGAGIEGSSTAYQLARQGKKTLLLEQVRRTATVRSEIDQSLRVSETSSMYEYLHACFILKVVVVKPGLTAVEFWQTGIFKLVWFISTVIVSYHCWYHLQSLTFDHDWLVVRGFTSYRQYIQFVLPFQGITELFDCQFCLFKSILELSREMFSFIFFSTLHTL